MPATPPALIYFATVGGTTMSPYRTPPADTDLLYMDKPKVGYDRLRAFALYPEEKITIGGKEYRRGIWRKNDYTKHEKKLIGFKFDGVLVSCTESDQNGLAIIADKIRKYDLTVDVVLENGNVLRVWPHTVDALEVAFLQHRQTFFTDLVPMNDSLKAPQEGGENE